jgi:hypothetical protein
VAREGAEAYGRRVSAPLIAHNTPLPLARAIVRRLPIRPGQMIVEGHVGTGAFVEALALEYPNHGLRVEVGDLNPDSLGLRPAPEIVARFASFRAYPGVDFLKDRPWREPDWIVSNPPYGDEATRDEAEPHVRRALEVIRPGGSVSYLLQNGFTFGTGRYERIWREGSGIPRCFEQWNIVGRPPFHITGAPTPEHDAPKKKGQTNRYEYVNLWWNAAVPNPRTVLDWLVDEDARRAGTAPWRVGSTRRVRAPATR